MFRNTRQLVARAPSAQPHTSKEMLLPMSNQDASRISLENHLALAVCRKGQGNAHLLIQLKRAVYLTYYLQQSGFGDAPFELYRHAHFALNLAGDRGLRDGAWLVSAEVADILERILAIHDHQLMSAGVRNVIQAKARLSRLLENKRRSPFRKTEGSQITERRDHARLRVSATASGV